MAVHCPQVTCLHHCLSLPPSSSCACLAAPVFLSSLRQLYIRLPASAVRLTTCLLHCAGWCWRAHAAGSLRCTTHSPLDSLCQSFTATFSFYSVSASILVRRRAALHTCCYHSLHHVWFSLSLTHVFSTWTRSMPVLLVLGSYTPILPLTFQRRRNIHFWR